MPSSVTFSAATATNKASTSSIYTRPQKKQKMSITQTYFLAHSARGKLSKEAARGDHDLRLLVGHANMLDSLMLDLANAEQEQERWFNNIVNGSQEEEAETPRHVETIVEEPEQDWELEDAVSSDEESEDEEKVNTQITAIEVDSDMSEDDDEDNDALSLVRTASRHSPPELSLDSDDSESDDEQMPPSPPTLTIDVLSEKQRRAIATTSFYDANDNTSLSAEESEAFEQEGFYLPSRQQPTIIAAY